MLIGRTTERMQKNSAAILDRLRGILSDLSSAVGHDSSSATLPVCESHDRDSFIKRVRSFKSSSWFAKPRWLSPVLCARYGWVNDDVDLLHCVGCQSVLVVRSPSSFDPAIYDACKKRLEDQLKQAAHHPCCTWPSCPTPAVIILAHSTSSSQAVVAEDFINKAQLLYSVGKDLPTIECSSLNVTESDITALCSLVRNSPKFLQDAEIPDALQSAVLLALTGWDLSEDGKAYPGCISVQCFLCMRQPGLWNYVSITGANDIVPDVESENSGEPVLDDHANTEEEPKDLQNVGSHSPSEMSNGKLSSREADVMQPTTDDTDVSAVVEECMDLQESVISAQDVGTLNDMQDRLPSTENDEFCSAAVNSDKDDNSEGVTDDKPYVADIAECGDYSDVADVAHESVSDYLPSDSKNSTGMSSGVDVVERCTELTENLDGNEKMACDGQENLPTETVQQEPDDIDVAQETAIEQSMNNDDELAADDTSSHKQTEFDAAGSATEEIVSNAANVSTAHEEHTGSHEPCETVVDCSPSKFISSDVCDDGNPEDLSCASLEPPDNSVDVGEGETVKTEFVEEAMHADESVIQCDEPSEVVESFPQEFLQKSADAATEVVALDLTSTVR